MMLRSLPILAVLALAGCGAANVQQLRDDPPHSISAHSPDDVPTTVQRVAAGLRRCYKTPVDVEYFSPDQPADITMDPAGGYTKVMMNIHVAPADAGSTADIDYVIRTWAKNADVAARLVRAEPPDC